MMSEILDIVDDDDIVIGQTERSVAHRDGLKIRLVYIWFYTPDGHIIMQRRSPTKAAYPNRLVCAASGHVGTGTSYVQAAVKETREETGIIVDEQKLEFAGKVFEESRTRNDISAAFRACYIYSFHGAIDDLVVEKGEGAGFELWEPHRLLHALDETPDNFSAFMLTEMSRDIIRHITRVSS